jgi:hypothetical protein
MTGDRPPRSTAEMMADIVGHMGALVRAEADLARTEIAESAGRAGASVGAMALALVIGIAGLNLIAAGLVALAVWAGLPPPWAAPVVGAALILLALAIYFSAKSSLQQIGFVPTRAARNVQRDVAAVKDSFNDK